MSDIEKEAGTAINEDELDKVSGGFGQYFGNDNCGDWTVRLLRQEVQQLGHAQMLGIFKRVYRCG